MVDLKFWRDRSLSEHQALRDAAAADLYRYQSLSLYGTTAAPLYAAVMVKWDPTPAQHDFSLQSRHDMAATIAGQAELGYQPTIIGAVGSAADPRFAAVFAKGTGNVASLAMTNGSATDSRTIQYAMAAYKAAGLILRWGAIYGSASDPRFAAIWAPQGSDPYLWNADGVLESGSLFSQRIAAQKQAFARPYFAAGSAAKQLLSAFACNEVGHWDVVYDVAAQAFDTSYASHVTTDQMIPVSVVGAGDDVASARYTAVFTADEAPTARTFHAAGPVANAAIDAVVQTAMQKSPVRHAALAIVNGARLVYARGYTLAEPDWPQAQPTTFFRIASDSKTVTAFAAYQLCEADPTLLDRKVQDILQLATPSGGAPVDPAFANITVRHLIEHRSGVDPGANWDSAAIRNAFVAAGHPIDFPVSRAQTDAYIASRPLVSAPGSAYAYNNCGYYLLGRVVTKLRAASDLIGACASLFGPLGITRIRNAESLASQQPADEARYQTSQLTIGASVMTNAQPLVPDTMGTIRLATLEGGGGLSGAATDLARLAAIVIAGEDTGALRYATIASMMQAGIAATAAHSDQARPGYGWDAISYDAAAQQFYAQKGGDLDTDHSCIQLDHDWGFVMLWSASPFAATGWYPNYPDVMNLAKAATWSSDLFPQFGMASL
jgi:CubicO group peptidase (beta-lactamase class C family)|nr:serine hydrolase domain-containing protein [Kofleriaceae bacterium]